ncbi:MAG: hypothetical protein WCH65_03740 [bacterium]
MKKLRVSVTDTKRIVAIPKPTEIPNILEKDERIIKNWYYNQPKELESFLKKNPNEETNILTAFSYWVKVKFQKLENKKSKGENQKFCGKLKRNLQKFSKALFKKLRAIAGKIGTEIFKFLYPKQKKIKVTTA